MEKYDKKSIVPPMSTFPNDNSEMFCNYAREEPMEERCLACSDPTCKHRGEKTLIEK